MSKNEKKVKLHRKSCYPTIAERIGPQELKLGEGFFPNKEVPKSIYCRVGQARGIISGKSTVACRLTTSAELRGDIGQRTREVAYTLQ
jgi:hypothetical protein